MMRRLSLALLVIGLSVWPAIADDVPESCRPKVAGTALALADEAEAAQLQCDIDRAALLSARSEMLFNVSIDSDVRIVDTASPSGAAYVYDIIDKNGQLSLDARSVPTEQQARGRTPVCRLRTQVDAAASQQIRDAAASIVAEKLPHYGKREQVEMNPDGSRRVTLLLDTHDIITTVAAPDGPQSFSRHALSTDAVTALNTLIIGIANKSSDWVCNKTS